MTGGGVDRELLAVLVALEPLDDRKWDYVDLRKRTFHADQMLEVPWSSGERILVDVAASLWNTGTVDLGYIACALSGPHLQAVIDAAAVRAGHELTSNVNRAVARISQGTVRPAEGPRRPAEESHIGSPGDDSPVHRQSRGLGR